MNFLLERLITWLQDGRKVKDLEKLNENTLTAALELKAAKHRPYIIIIDGVEKV
jgi:hypothetical protein